VLAREQPTVAWPAPSTITTLLIRAGLGAQSPPFARSAQCVDAPP
jgi:hypothetical protein